MKAQLARAQALLNLKKPKTDEAMQLLQPIINRKNAPWPAFHFSGIAYVQKGEYDMALSFLSEALKQGSDEPETYHSMSICYFNMGNFDEAEEYAEKALDRNPEFFKGWLHLGSLYRAQAKLDDALKCFQKANQIDPKSASVAFRIGQIYDDQGVLNKALELYNITLKIDGEYTEAYLAKAEVLKKQSNYEEAEEAIYEVLSQNPRNVAAKVSLAELFKYRGNYEKALELYERLIEQYPNLAGARVNYALCLQELGVYEESEKNYLQAFKDSPKEFESLSNYLMALHYNPTRSKQEIFEAHKLWDKHFAPEERPQRPIPLDSSTDKKLRVGFISGGFRAHPVGWMITKALENLPKIEFEIYCYTTHNKYDQVTKQIHQASNRWQSVVGYNDHVIANMIREDEIDILVELSGHSADTRLKTVVMEPAPIIVKWVGGLFNTTGMQSVDYLITDHQETPEGEEEFYTEKLVRMPDDYICFMPPDYSPDVAELPAKKEGVITFGCFNNPTKVNDETLEKWAEIMNQVTSSRLFLKSKQYDTKALRDRIIETMASAGISEDRLIFEGLSQHHILLEKYNEVDIALDPWPYSGGLTTCEALWMGVPVVTKPGPTFAGRHSATHLYNAGFAEWITNSWDEYIEKVVALASDVQQLSEIRKGLREKVAASPVCNGVQFGAHLSKAFREMWKQRVDGYKKNLPEGKWQDHIEIESFSAEEIDHYASRKDALEQVDKMEDDFIRQGIKEAVEDAQNYSNGSANGNAEHQNGTAEEAEETPETYYIETKDGITICTPPDMELMTPYVLLEQNDWYENELDFIRDYLKAGMNFVDVGAGFGVYALPAAKLVGEEGKVFTFEPGVVAKKHLELSKLENDFQNLEIIGKAVSDKAGKQNWKLAETPVLSKIDESGEDKVQAITLDSWWHFEGEPKVDFLKVDVSGNELQVLESAIELLEKENPVLLVAISQQNVLAVSEKLISKGFKVFEYIPGPRVLAELEPDADFDVYTQNLIAVKNETVAELKEQGWIFDETSTVEEPKSGLWKQVLAPLPWTESLLEKWQDHDDSEGVQKYLLALDYLAAAQKLGADKYNSGSQKALLLLHAAERLIALYNQGANSTSVVFTLVRTLNALGKRGQAVEVMQKLIETTKLGQENMNVDLPFMLPIPEQDHASINTDLPKWLMVKTVEAWILLKGLTTYLSGKQEKKLLEVLKGNPEVIDRINAVSKVIGQSKTSELIGGIYSNGKGDNSRSPKVVHICFNHVYAQSLSDLVEYVNENSEQEHRLFIETHQAIPNYSVQIQNNPASVLFNYQNNLQSILQECLKENVDMVMFHGIFFDWQKKLINAIGDKKHIGWFIWGGDLYNPIRNGTKKLFPANKIESVHTSFSGDLQLFTEHYEQKAEYDFAYPYPGLYGDINVEENIQHKWIIVGNSGDRSNDHTEILKELSRKSDIEDYEIILPVAYNFSSDYKIYLERFIKDLGLEKLVKFYTEFIRPEKYMQFLNKAEIVITAHNRQQSMGNLLMSLFLNNPSFLRREIEVNGKLQENPGWTFLTDHKLNPIPYESLKDFRAISDISRLNKEIQKFHQKIIKEEFGLQNRGNQLIGSCNEIKERFSSE